MGKTKNTDISLKDGEYLVRSGSTRIRLSLDGRASVAFGQGAHEGYSVLDGDPESGEFTLLFRNVVYRVSARENPDGTDIGRVSFDLNEEEWSATVDDRRSLLARRFGKGGGPKTGDVVLRAPMPGLVSRVLVSEGQSVKKGDGLLILEAMKMENELKADHDGTIVRVECTEGKPVDKNGPLLLLHYSHPDS